MSTHADPQAFESCQFVEGYESVCQDVVAIEQLGSRMVAVLADGAGGSGAGLSAAKAAVKYVRSQIAGVSTSEEWGNVVSQLDNVIAQGETTIVVVDIDKDGIRGASVGDSQAKMYGRDEEVNLTANQKRKPLLGSGSAVPVPFDHPAPEGILLLGSDGFWNYAKPDRIAQCVRGGEFFELPRRLADSARLQSGNLNDDISIIAVRKRKIRPPRKVYELLDNV